MKITRERTGRGGGEDVGRAQDGLGHIVRTQDGSDFHVCRTQNGHGDVCALRIPSGAVGDTSSAQQNYTLDQCHIIVICLNLRMFFNHADPEINTEVLSTRLSVFNLSQI